MVIAVAAFYFSACLFHVSLEDLYATVAQIAKPKNGCLFAKQHLPSLVAVTQQAANPSAAGWLADGERKKAVGRTVPQ